MVLNVSDAGMAVSMAIAVGDETYANVNVRINGLPQSVEVRGRMAWNLPGRKRAGIELVDVSPAQREKIREWIALDGVRDVNLLPRVEEFSAGASRVGEDFAQSSRASGLPILDKNSEAIGAAENTGTVATTPLAVAALPLPELREAKTRTVADVPAASDLPKEANVTAAFVPAVQPTLLDMFGGTPPESLGPLPERFADGERTLRSEASLGIGAVDSIAFRENEWDLASVTMVPRKKSRPAWSTVGFVLLWVAIPCFGLGALIGRRPLEHWLASHGAEKNVTANQESSVVAANESSNVAALPKAAAVEPTQIPESETLQPPATAGAGEASSAGTNAERLDRDGWRDLSGSAVYGGSGDSKLLNSLSTQEARALKNVPRGSSAATESAASTNTPKEIFRDSSGGNISSVATKINPVVAPAEVARNSGSASQGTIAAQNFRADTTKDTAVKAPATPATGDTARPVAGNSVASAASSNVPRSNVQTPASVDAANVAVSHSYDAGASSIAAKPVATTPSNATDTAANSVASSQSASNIAPAGSGSSGVAAAPKSGANNVAVSVASAPASASVAVNPVNVNAAASAAPVVATPSTQPPLRGTVLVARKSDEAFLLKLPVESISSDESVATRMQRTVMVPAQSRWHGHGPIAKVAVGELLSNVKLDGADGGVKARAGESVTVRAYVDRNGDIEQLKAVSGRAALAPRVMRAVREWQFDQTRVDGKAVDSEVDITVEFRR